jgi:hypothetical protein
LTRAGRPPLPVAVYAAATIYALLTVSNQLFAGGYFTNVDGVTVSNLAAFDLTTGTLKNWTPNPNSTMDDSTIVENLSIIDNTLYVCGQFYHAGGETARGLAAFPLGLTGTPTLVANSTRLLGDGSVRFRLQAPGALEATVLTSSNLTDWLPLQTVPLIDGNGVFTDPNATNFSRRFYRVSVP